MQNRKPNFQRLLFVSTEPQALDILHIHLTLCFRSCRASQSRRRMMYLLVSAPAQGSISHFAFRISHFIAHFMLRVVASLENSFFMVPSNTELLVISFNKANPRSETSPSCYFRDRPPRTPLGTHPERLAALNSITVIQHRAQSS